MAARGDPGPGADDRARDLAGAVSVVIATRDRPAELARTLTRLGRLRPAPPVIVVDNASRAPATGLHRYPVVHEVVRLSRNLGAAGRNVGVQLAPTRYVAFSDDDSWWAPGALPVAARALDQHPALGLVAGHTLVGPAGRPDPVNAALAGSPLPPGPGTADLPGPPVLGCLACATVVRREAYLAVGGFSPLMSVGGEEELLCYDLAAAGWARCYLPQAVAHHHPSPRRAAAWRRAAVQRRNRVLVAWLRRPLPVAAALTTALVRQAPGDRVARTALAGLLRRLPAALAARRPLPPAVEAQVRQLEQRAAGGGAERATDGRPGPSPPGWPW